MIFGQRGLTEFVAKDMPWSELYFGGYAEVMVRQVIIIIMSSSVGMMISPVKDRLKLGMRH